MKKTGTEKCIKINKKNQSHVDGSKKDIPEHGDTAAHAVRQKAHPKLGIFNELLIEITEDHVTDRYS